MTTTKFQRTFAIPLTSEANIDLCIAEDNISADNLGLITWISSFVLARQLHTFGLDLSESEDIPILEIGAGTGLVGLTAAKLFSKKTILTDLPGIVPGLRTNVDLNAQVLGEVSKFVHCGSLDWITPQVLTLESGEQLDASRSKATIILAADTIYDEDHPELLANTILTWLARTPTARVIFTYSLRVAYLDYIRDMWERLENAGLVAEQEGQEQGDTKEWDDECLCEWVVWRWKDV